MSTVAATKLSPYVPALRQMFPSLRRMHHGRPVIYLDGPAGSQVPQQVVDAISDYYLHHNANRSGKFATSQETDRLIQAAHVAAAAWFGTEDPTETIFGANMTTITFAFSRALSKTWKPGDRILVTQLDHDGNVTPWRMAAEDVGAEVEQIRVRATDATLDWDHLEQLLESPTRLLAITGASNSVGSRTDIATIVRLAHRAGAEVYLDAVHLAPHCGLDVKAWDVDYCVCSAYKFFGPHVGLLYGKRSKLESLVPYKLRPAPSVTPGKWMTGTQNHAAICGVRAAIEYVADIGRQLANASALDTRASLIKAFEAIEEYEQALVEQLIHGLCSLPHVEVYGITQPDRFSQRVPTVAMNVRGRPSAEVALELGERGIYCWHGDYYAVDVCHALGQQPQGMVRLGLMHTNTPEEVHQALEALR